MTIGDGAELTTDCFLMKGEQVPAGARWGGNPASEMRDRQLVAAGSSRTRPERSHWTVLTEPDREMVSGGMTDGSSGGLAGISRGSER